LQTNKLEDAFDETRKELMETRGLRILHISELDNDEILQRKIKKIFKEQLFPLLQPLVLKNELPLPEMEDNGLFILTKLEYEGERGLSGIIKLPEEKLIPVDSTTFLFQSEVIEKFIGELYKGKKILWNKIFRVYRKISSIYPTNNSTDNYVNVIKSELEKRKKADIIMVDIDSNINVLDPIIGSAKKRKRRYPAGLGFLKDIKRVIDYDSSMVYSKHKPRIPATIMDSSMFETLSKRDVLCFFPYESFEYSTIRFLEEAAVDPNVISIKQTLYRVANNSRLTSALMKAAKNKKQVVVLLELKAKLDESHNLFLVDRLKAAGCNIIFGPVDMKIHAKTTLVIRREGDKIAKYCNIATGNFNESTAGIYEDLSYFCKETKKYQIGTDLCNLFNYLGGFSNITSKHLLISPINFRSTIEEEIRKCIDKGGRMILKMNSLTDEKMVELLYEASRKGVHIKLFVRGMCILRPGVEGMSDNIEVYSIVGRFLEHSRIYEFTYDEGCDHIYIGSGDLMPRNLDHRVEVLVPIKNKLIIDSINEYLEMYSKDTRNKYKLLQDGSYRYPSIEVEGDGGESTFSVQNECVDKYKKIEKSIIR
jgi:polyphosphate kinase